MRMTRGRCSFELPEGFRLVESPDKDGGPRCQACSGQVDQWISVTLVMEDAKDPQELSFEPRDMDPAAYPMSLSLTSVPGGVGGNPMQHAKQIRDVLGGRLQGFKTKLMQECEVSKSPGAKAWFSFETNFRLDQLIYIWKLGGDTAKAIMSVAEVQVEDAWPLLTRFVESVEL